jgi:hypothetical protein
MKFMTQTLTLPGEVYRKLSQGAVERGMTIESLLAAVSELFATSNRRQRGRVERLLERLRAGRASAEDRAELDRLIGADYEEANARADKLIHAKKTARAMGGVSPRSPRTPSNE